MELGTFFDSIERFEGSNHDDTIDGSESHDAGLLGAQGNDTINGHGGNDLLEGNDGDDVLDGGDGDDLLLGGLGADFLVGGNGIDTIAYFGSKAPVTVKLFDGTAFGGEAEGDSFQSVEYLVGAPAPVDANGNPVAGGDWLEGSFFDNVISGLSGSDVIFGHAGNDVLYGDFQGSPLALHPGFDNDTIFGGDGNDHIYGQADNDFLDGGAGSDVVDGGTGNDELSVGTMRGPTQDPNRLDNLDGGEGFDIVSADFSNQIAPIHVIAGTLNALVFADGAQALNFETVRDFFSGSGNDIIDVTGATDTGLPNFFMTNGGSDFVFSGLGDDIVDLGDGDDYVEGGLGSDTLNGGPGRDILSYANSPGSVFVDLQLSGTTGLANSDSFNDQIANFEILYGSAFADDLRGTAGDNFIDGGAGNDFVDARGGNDVIFGGLGADTISTGDGTNSVFGEDGGDVITGGSEADTLNGDAGNDQINAGDGKRCRRGWQRRRFSGRRAGRDALRYLSSPALVIVDLQLSTPTGPLGSDAVAISSRISRISTARHSPMTCTAPRATTASRAATATTGSRGAREPISWSAANGNDLLEVGTLRLGCRILSATIKSSAARVSIRSPRIFPIRRSRSRSSPGRPGPTSSPMAHPRATLKTCTIFSPAAATTCCGSTARRTTASATC
jgi:Ca2+-binding RTX toxin-like protein